MRELNIGERRQRLLAAGPDSAMAREVPTLVRTGRAIIERRWNQVACLCAELSADTDAYCQAGLSITPVIKPVGNACNLRCRYCGYHATATPTATMSLDLLEKIMREFLPRAPGGVDFIFHGGEPLLAGIGFFQAALEIQARHARPGQEVRNHVQTNGTLVNEEWARFLAGHSFYVGISLDGPESVHDRNRVRADGTGSHASVLRGIACLHAARARTQAIAVVPPRPQISPQELFAFIQSSGIPRWRVNPCRVADSVSTYPEYVDSLFQSWARQPDACVISLFSEVLEGLLGYPVQTCWMKGSCRRFVGFDPDGTVSPCCEMPVPPEHVYGNLNDQTLESLLNGPTSTSFWNAHQEGTALCTGCEWRHLCGGGCAHLRIQGAGSPAGRDILCGLYKATFSRLTQRIDDALGRL